MDNVLLPSETEFYIDTMRVQNLEELGSRSWIEWHKRLQKLNQQAIVEASCMQEENVKELFVSLGKVPHLVQEAILISIWKFKVLPLLLKMESKPETTFIAYSILYHEAICVALLELIMYYSPVVESLEEVGADLLDYACGAVSHLLLIKKQKDDVRGKEKEEILRQKDDLSFEIAIRCLTIIRYLAEYLERLPMSVTSGMYKTSDVPVLLIQILLERPWIRDGKSYSGGRWFDWDGEVLNKVEAQVWIGLQFLLLNSAVNSHYPITESRKTQILKILPLLVDTLLDQLSPLQQLKYHLCSLSVNKQPTEESKPLIIEPVLEIKNNITKKYQGKWKSIAKQQLKTVFCKNKEELLEIAQCLNEAFNSSLLEKLEPQGADNACAKCGNRAIQRCSHCKAKWYCSRKCQVEHWSLHKEECLNK